MLTEAKDLHALLSRQGRPVPSAALLENLAEEPPLPGCAVAGLVGNSSMVSRRIAWEALLGDDAALPPEPGWEEWLAAVDWSAASTLAGSAGGTELPAFAEVLAPLIAHAEKNARASLERLSLTAQQSLLQLLLRELHAHAHQGLYAAFDQFRDKRMMAEGALEGDHFTAFSRMFTSHGDALSILAGIPGLARLLGTLALHWQENVHLLVTRLEKDGARLAEALRFTAALEELESVTSPGGDRHGGGSTVLLLKFREGKIIYKPRSMVAEARWSELLRELAAESPKFAPPPLRVVQPQGADSHGWAGYCEVASFTSEDELRSYHRKCGSLLALVHLLGGSDLHMENIMATAEGPVLVDAECLLQPSFDSGARAEAESSVMRTGLLPQPGKSSHGERVDISGFAGVGGYRLPLDRITYASPRTAIMTPRREKTFAPLAGNKPLLAGHPVEPAGYLSEIEEGIRQTSRLFRTQKEAWHRRIQSLAGIRLRCLLRPTSVYGRILSQFVQPAILREGGRGMSWMLEDLATPLLRSETPPPIWQALPAERAALIQYDIPVFHTLSDSVDVWAGPGVCLQGFFRSSGLNAALHRLAGWEAEEERSCTLLRQSFASASSLGGHDIPEAAASPPVPPAAALARSIAGAAPPPEKWLPPVIRSLVEKIISTAQSDGHGHPCWPELLLQTGQVRGTALGGSHYLYGGTAGLAIFLGAAGHVLDDARATQLARRLVEMYASALGQSSVRDALTREPLGAVTGLGSLLLTLVALSQWPEAGGPSVELAESIASIVTPEQVGADREHDVMAGLAGWIMALSALHRARPTEATRERLSSAASSLLAKRTMLPSGKRGWVDSGSRSVAGGFAHGAAGMALALHRAAEVLGADAAPAVAECLAIESKAFDPQLGNWVVTTGADGRPLGMNAWCNGTAGMCLALAEIIGSAGSKGPSPEIFPPWQTSLRALLEGSPARTDHLCCGNVGRITIGRSVAEWLPAALPQGWPERALALLEMSVRHRGGFVLDGGVINGASGFFRGVSGIGYGLLRQLHPHAVPDMISLRAHLPLPQPPTT